MKYIDEEGRLLISKIWEIGNTDNAVLTNIFEDVIYGKHIAFDLEGGTIIYEYEEYKSRIQELINVQKTIIKRALLIRYLEENDFIYIINETLTEKMPPYIGDDISHPVIQTLPTEIADILRKTLYRIYADDSLMDYIQRGYKTADDIVVENSKEQTEEAKKQTSNSQKTLWLAFITMLISVVTPIVMSFCNETAKYYQDVIDSIKEITIVIKETSQLEIDELDSLNSAAYKISEQKNEEIQILNQYNRMLKKLNKNIR